MNLGEVRDAVDVPKLFGAVDTGRMADDRNVVVQVYMGENEYGSIYEYREVEAIGTLFFKGEFTIVIAAGQVA